MKILCNGFSNFFYIVSRSWLARTPSLLVNTQGTPDL
ncbi:hypothetical protein SAMN05443244_2856 [Terriglobus roseus]|uniref:Uncharacterized protein n=1 Tax=Terriglobus roseus TaxID=392734 RepID=A0A1H4QFB7_9BACT|nr:hypothetical protein SAMN05443244_2856 [Terriglobus roseus]